MRREYEQDLEKIAQLQRFYDRFHAKKDKAKQAKAKLTQIERIKRGLREPPRQTKSFKLGLPQPKPSARVVLEMKTPALCVGAIDDPAGVFISSTTRAEGLGCGRPSLKLLLCLGGSRSPRLMR